MANPSVEEKIKAAAAAKGIPPELALKIANSESSYSSDAKNPRSTAGGLFQIVDKTWKNYGGAPGKKYDVDENIRVGTDIIADNLGRMRKVLNREPSYSEVYAAHFFGPTGAKDVLNADPGTPTDKLFSAKVLRDNPNLQDKTAAEVMAMLDKKMGVVSKVATAKPAPAPAATVAPKTYVTPRKETPFVLGQADTAPAVPRETMLAALGPGYQAAMALSYLSNSTDEGDSDLETAKERIAADKESARSPGMEWLAQESRPSPFAGLDLTASAPFAPPVAQMKDGGDVSKKKVSPLSERFDLGKAGEFDPIGNAKKTLQGAWDVAKNVPGNVQRLVTDPVAYAKRLPEPSAQQLLNALGPSNVGGPLVAGIMMGPKSRTWNQKAYEDAVQLAGSKGNLMSPEEVWKRTGTISYATDYVPRQEINDSKARFRIIPPDKLKTEKDHAVRMVDWIDRQLSSKDSGNMSMDERQNLLNMRTNFADKVAGLSRDPYTEGMPAKYMLEHPELYAAYPQLADTTIRLYKGNNGIPGAETAGAYWDKANNAVNINGAMVNNLKYSRFDPRSAALHEMQHAVQDIEGMSQGTNPNAYQNDMDNFLKFYEKRANDPTLTQQKATELAKDDWYRAHQGEAEARQAEARANMTDVERRNTFPEYDVSPDVLLSPLNPNLSHGGAVHRADGSPPTGETPQKDNTVSSKAAAMLRGFGDTAYDIAGAPVDLTTMAMRLAGYNAEKPILGSDWIKQKAQEYGIRPGEETDPQLNRLRQGSEFVTGFINPAVPARAAAAATTKSAEMLKELAKSEAAYNLAQKAMASPMMGAGMAGPMYIVRQPGGEFPTSRMLSKDTKPLPFSSKLDEQLKSRIEAVLATGGTNPALKPNAEAVANFFDTKMRDWYTKQAGSVNDPVREALITGKIKLPKDSVIEETFPKALIDAARQGDMTSMKLLENAYDAMVDVRGHQAPPPNMTSTEFENRYAANILNAMKANPSTIPDSMLLRLTKQDVSKLSAQEAQQKIAAMRAKLAENPNLFNTILEPKIERLIKRDLFDMPVPIKDAEKQANLNPKTNPLAATNVIYDVRSNWVSKLFGMSESELESAAMQIDPKELSRMGMTEFLAKTSQIHAAKNESEMAASAVAKAIDRGRPAPTAATMYGTKELLPKDATGYQWREVIDPYATKIQAKMLDNSIAGYSRVGTYGSANGGINAMKNGDVRIFSLYNPEGYAVSNVEYLTPTFKRGKGHYHEPNTIPQFTGNGVMTGNALPENYGPQIVDLLNFLKPDKADSRATSVLEKSGLINQLDSQALQKQFPHRATGGMIERQPDDNRRYL